MKENGGREAGNSKHMHKEGFVRAECSKLVRNLRESYIVQRRMGFADKTPETK